LEVNPFLEFGDLFDDKTILEAREVSKKLKILFIKFW